MTNQRSKSKHQEPCIVLLSGGLDSATTLAIAREQGFVCHAISFDYGQRHCVELEAAGRVADHLGAASHCRVRIDTGAWRDPSGLYSGSALTGDLDVPKDRDEAQMTRDIPVTYVPARNTIFLSHALALAEVLAAVDIFIAVNAVDYSGYPDCRPQYIAAFQKMAALATKTGVEGRAVRIHTPLINWPKTKIIQRGLELGVDFGLTHSCYDPDPSGRPCVRCDACLLRKRAFEALGRTDPVLGGGE